LHEGWFDRLGMRRQILDLLSEFPFLTKSVARAAVADARGRPSVELFGGPGHYTVAIGMTPALLLEKPRFDASARHELQHIEDMLDPAFGFDRALQPSGATLAGQNLTRDRYAVLWAINIDARSAARSRAVPDLDRRKQQFARVFGWRDEQAMRTAFDA